MEDLIRRSDAIELVAEYIGCDYAREEEAIENATMLIETIPTIEPMRGEWIDEAGEIDASFGIHDYRCSNCNSYADEYIGGHEWYTMYKPNYCPNCGAKMK